MKALSHCRLMLMAVFALAAVKAGAQAVDPVFDQLKSYYYGRDTSALDKIAAMVSHARNNASERPAVEAGLRSVLTSGASFDAKQFACRELAFVAGPDDAPAL